MAVGHPISFATAKAAIRRVIKKRWARRLEDPSSASKVFHRECTEGRVLKDHPGTREEERTLAQLRTGCCKHLQSYMHHMHKHAVPADCPDCGSGEPETTQHFLSCPAASATRQDIFGTTTVPPTALRKDTEKILRYLRERGRLSPLPLTTCHTTSMPPPASYFDFFFPTSPAHTESPAFPSPEASCTQGPTAARQPMPLTPTAHHTMCYQAERSAHKEWPCVCSGT